MNLIIRNVGKKLLLQLLRIAETLHINILRLPQLMPDLEPASICEKCHVDNVHVTCL